MEFDVFDKISDLETKLHYMREQLREKDEVICQLKREIESLKCNNYYENPLIKQENSAKTAIESLADNGKSIADSLKEVSDSCMQSTGYIYDDKTGLYYDKNSGYYYDPENQLFFNPRSGTYHTYDPETKEYSYHSRASASELKKIIEENSIKASLASVASKMKESRNYSPRGRKYNNSRSRSNSSRRHRSRSDHRSHRGHRRSRTRSRSSSKHSRRRKRYRSPIETPKTLSSNAVKYPPVLRCSILSSKCYNIGKLVVITSKDALSRWATLGKSSSLCPMFTFENDDDMEDMHCEIIFNKEKQIYLLKDKHTKNGTFINGKRLEKSHKQKIAHGDILRIGTNRILLHIHEGTAQCEQCNGTEQPDTKLKVKVDIDISQEIPEEEIIEMLLANQNDDEPLEQNRRNTLKDLKSKYGLLGEDQATRVDRIMRNSQYKDRAADRRKYRPDKTPVTTDQDLITPLPPLSEVEKSMPKASLDNPIDHQRNVGAKLMSKMGWTPGYGLGKNEGGISEPIKVTPRENAHCGFGCNIESKKEIQAKKTRERYDMT